MEILTEIVKRNTPVRATDFTSLIELVAELEEFRRQARLYGDASEFDKPDFILRVVAARATCLEERWGKHALRRRTRGEVVDFNMFLKLIEEEATALEKPEGAKARALAHNYVSHIRGSSSSKTSDKSESGLNWKGGQV